MAEILTVSDLTEQIKRTLEDEFPSVGVIGEISNFKAHSSGHWYFTLKDSNAQISCTMWKGLNSYVFFSPEDGMKVVINGRLNVYPPRGSYQLDVKSMKPAGIGELQAAFERLKEKLRAEGLFSEQRKRPIPPFPSKIGIASAGGGAALKDMISVAERRFPLAELVIAPCRVQGEGASIEIVESIRNLNRYGGIDVIIVGRGGGSLEDLWAFNEERVARAIFNSIAPVVSAVGHEVDYTISDFVADLRAPTPSAAMEIITPDQNDIFAFISDFSYTSHSKILSIIENFRKVIKQNLSSYGFKVPYSLIMNNTQTLDNEVYKLHSEIKSNLNSCRNSIQLFEKSLGSFDEEKTLKRGFSIIKQNGASIEREAHFQTTEPFQIKFYDKEIKINVNDQKK